MSQKPVTHTPEPWKLRGNEIGKKIVSDDQSHGMMLSIAFVDKYDFEDTWEANARRIVACVNQLEEFTTEELEQKPIGQLMAERAFLASAGPDAKSGGFAFKFEGGACGIMAAAFAGQLKGTGAPNFIEMNFTHPEIDGPIAVTIQRVNGKSPGQLRSEAVAQRDELLAALKEIRNLSAAGLNLHTPGATYTNRFATIKQAALDAIAKAEKP